MQPSYPSRRSLLERALAATGLALTSTALVLIWTILAIVLMSLCTACYFFAAAVQHIPATPVR